MAFHENHQRRAALHARQSWLNPVGRAEKDDGDDADAADTKAKTTTTTKKPVKTTTTKAKTTSTTSTTTSSSTTTTTSSTTSSTSSTSTTSTTSTTTSTTSTTSSVTPTLPPVTTPLTTDRALSTTSSASIAASSATTTPQSASNTTTLVAGIGGGIVGAIGLAMLIAFIIRHVRKRRNRLTFDKSQFRQSAMLLNDDKVDASGASHPRPPSMFERRNRGGNTPAPMAAYPYSDLPSPPQPPSSTYGHTGEYSNYGQGAQYGYGAAADPFDQPTHGAAPIPGQHSPATYASYGGYGAAAGYPQQQAGGYAPYHQSPQMPHSSVGGYPYGNNNQTASPPASEYSSLPHPVSREPTAPSSVHGESPDPALQLAATSTLRRQNTQVGGAPPAYDDDDGQYVALQRATKARLNGDMAVSNSDPTGPSAAAPVPAASVNATTTTTAATAAHANQQRPESHYSLYGADDAYGGM